MRLLRSFCQGVVFAPVASRASLRLFSFAKEFLMSNIQPLANPSGNGSTGPRTEAGKAASSQNARKHDLCSKTLRLSPEEWVDYNDVRERYARDLRPADDVEQTLVDEICFNYWRLQQAREAELTIIDRHATALPLISLYIRYRTGYERAFYKGLDQFQKRQSDRRKQAAQPATEVPLAAAPLAAPAVCSASLIPAAAHALDALKDELEEHHLENRVRSELCLPPLPIPAELSERVKEFVSQNPAHSHHLTEFLGKAA
jgi:hypothetical protein